jgi:putative flippase GtrA
MKNEEFVSKKTGVQFVKFAVVGVLNTAVDWLSFFLLTLAPFFDTNQTFAKGIAFVLAVINSFILNSLWTFKEEVQIGMEQAGKERARRGSQYFLKFLLVSLVGLLINTLAFGLTRGIVEGEYSENAVKLISLVAASAAATLWNFLANKFWTYR